MFFPLLESLLQKNSELSKARVREFFESDENPALLFKSLFTYAAQQDPSDRRNPNALVVCEALAQLMLNEKTEIPEGCIGKVIDFLCILPIESADTSVLKPLKGETKVVSVYDLEDAFKQNNPDVMYAAVRDILSLMDNKQYFMELIARIALDRSPQSIILTQSTANAIEIMDWKNNFTPFLIYHLITRIFLDKIREIAAGVYDESIFRAAVSQIGSAEDAQFFSACFQMASTSRIIPNKIRPKAGARVQNYVYTKIAPESSGPDEWISRLSGRAAAFHLSSFTVSTEMKLKFSL